MKPRLPTVEERKLWRESNKETRRLQSEPLHDPTDPAVITAKAGISGNADSLSFVALDPGLRRDDTRVPPALTPLSAREAVKRFRNHPLGATLDLHGEGKLDAREKVQQFLLRQAHAHRRHVVIITGKGKGGVPGVLREYLPDWLNEAPLRALISAIAYAPPEKGGAGVMHVLLKTP